SSSGAWKRTRRTATKTPARCCTTSISCRWRRPRLSRPEWSILRQPVPRFQNDAIRSRQRLDAAAGEKGRPLDPEPQPFARLPESGGGDGMAAVVLFGFIAALAVVKQVESHRGASAIKAARRHHVGRAEAHVVQLVFLRAAVPPSHLA